MMNSCQQVCRSARHDDARLVAIIDCRYTARAAESLAHSANLSVNHLRAALMSLQAGHQLRLTRTAINGFR